MLFKLKSVSEEDKYLAVAFEHCVTIKHFRFGDKIETSLNLFFLYLFPGV